MRIAGRYGLFAAIAVVAVFLAACSGGMVPPEGPQGQPQTEANTVDETAGTDGFADWNAVLSAAEGTTVNWFMWGGSEVINAHVDEAVGQPLREQYGITLNRVPLDNTADAVNKVLNERAAGKDEGGSVDLIWINGENFRTLKDADLLFGPFVDLLPNNQYVNWEDPAVANDFGVPVDGYESPWASFQFVMEYNTDTVGEVPPATFEELAAWAKENPGRFTYPAPPNHVGDAFVRQLFYWAAGGPEPFLGEYDQATYDRYAPVVWDYLNEIKPYLWREGQTYPELPALAEMLANQEVDFAMEYDASRASNFINQGRYPDSIRTFVFETGTVANTSYVAIPYNASNPAGAMVLANFLLSPDYQILITNPDELGWMVAIDPARLPADAQARLSEAPRGVATLPPEVLRSHALAESGAEWVAPMEEGWVENVLK